MRFVVIASPYAGDVERNVAYAELAMLDCMRRGESPYAAHLLLTRVLDDSDPHERKLGIKASRPVIDIADALVVYIDLGFSTGMRSDVGRAKNSGVRIEERRIRNFERRIDAHLAWQHDRGRTTDDDLRANLEASLDRECDDCPEPTPPRRGAHVDLGDGRPYCSVCGEPQFETPSGLTCKNRHGGAPSTTKPAVRMRGV